jgi:hypothetical protein
MSDRNFRIEGSHRRGQDGGRISLDKDRSRLMLVAPVGHRRENSTGKIRQSLTGLHEIQIMFWGDPKHPERLVKHLPMLSSGKKDGMKGIRFTQREINRRHFNGLRPSARNDRNCSFQIITNSFQF